MNGITLADLARLANSLPDNKERSMTLASLLSLLGKAPVDPREWTMVGPSVMPGNPFYSTRLDMSNVQTPSVQVTGKRGVVYDGFGRPIQKGYVKSAY
jgi:hypothetical protein